MTGLESSYKRSASQSAPIDIPATHQGNFGESREPCDFVSVDSSVGPSPIVSDSNMETGIEVDEGSPFSSYHKKDLGLGFNWGSLSSIKRSLFLSLFVLQVLAPIINEASNEAEDALVIHRGTGLPVVPLLIIRRRRAGRALLLPDDDDRARIERVLVRALRRMDEEFRGLGVVVGRNAAGATRSAFPIPTGPTPTGVTSPAGAAEELVVDI